MEGHAKDMRKSCKDMPKPCESYMDFIIERMHIATRRPQRQLPNPKPGIKQKYMFFVKKWSAGGGRRPHPNHHHRCHFFLDAVFHHCSVFVSHVEAATGARNTPGSLKVRDPCEGGIPKKMSRRAKRAGRFELLISPPSAIWRKMQSIHKKWKT